MGIKLVGIVAATAFLMAQAGLVTPANANIIVAPDLLNPGDTISPLPNGASTGETHHTVPYDETISFSFSDGLVGELRSRVISYSDAPSTLHPGLYFDYEIQLTSGSISAFTISSYDTFQTSVKECGISDCGGSGANGVLATSASRSSDGDELTFDFSNALTAGEHSANLQIFTSASLFQDPLAFFTDSAGNTFSIETVAPAVPETSTWSMMILGFCGLGFMGYRRKQNGAMLRVA